VQLPTVSNTRN